MEQYIHISIWRDKVTGVTFNQPDNARVLRRFFQMMKPIHDFSENSVVSMSSQGDHQ